MINKLSIFNFQCHKKLILNLNKHVTTIVGSSDSGKSAIMRAIRWLATNRPAGNWFIRKGSRKTGVKLYIDGHKISRWKGPKGNIYRLDGHRLAAFGFNVPNPILDALRVSPTVNFQAQHDAPFWFNLSPGDVSRQLNQVVDLESIDNTLSFLASMQRKSKQTIDILKTRLKDANDKRRELRFVRKAKQDYIDLEKTEQIHIDTQRRIGELKAAVANHIELVETSGKLRKCVADAQETDMAGEVWHKVYIKLTKLKILLGEIRQLEKSKASGTSIEQLEDLYKQYKQTHDSSNAVDQLIVNMKNGGREICRIKTNHDKTQKEIAEQIGRICPLCQQRIRQSL